MADVINSAYDALAELSVNELIEAPELFERALEELLEGEQAYNMLFSKENTDQMAVKYTEEDAPLLDSGLQKVAEFAEIPVADPTAAKVEKFAAIEDYALGIRISEKQRVKNLNNQVQRELVARARTIRRDNGLAAMAALKEAGIAEMPVAVAWDKPDADIREDIGLATDLIMSATDSKGRQYGYEPNVLWANPVTINRAKRNKTVKSDFIGDMASENPLFKKVGQNPLIGGYLQVVPDMSVPIGEAYIAVEQGVGVEAQDGAPKTTPFYEEGGQSGIGGPRMTWRSDYVHSRALFVPSTKAIVRLTGLATA